jgi:hypothetical protein
MIIDVLNRKRKSRHRALRRPTRTSDHAGERQHQLLHLQRQVGNVAVTRLLQRDRPASTDAPWASKHHSKPKAPAKLPDVHARVIAVRIDDGKTVITIAAGPDQGVQVGMEGSLIQSSGREVADFTIETAHGRVSTAHIGAIPDQIYANPNVVIKASRFAPESMEGKEF